MVKPTVNTDKATLINDTINAFFERSIAEATLIDASYRQLWETLYGLIRSGGKRLRPQMTLLGYEAFGGKHVDKMIPVAVAQELLHFSLLIHDDVIDRDYMRYGTLNIAGRYKVAYSKFMTEEDEKTHFAHSAAILGGDLMLSSAHQLIASSDLSEQEKTIAQQLLSWSVFEVAGGELLDTESSFVPYSSGDAIKIARYKTASYSFSAPLLTGARVAGISLAQQRILKEFADSLGIAFQLVDDVLSVFGKEETTGKSTTSDIVEGKRTFMVEHAVMNMSSSEKLRFEAIFGNHTATKSEIEEVRQILISTEAKAATEAEIEHLAATAQASLEELKLSEKYQEEFERLIDKVTKRKF